MDVINHFLTSSYDKNKRQICRPNDTKIYR